jgi:hypothetical protein
MCGATFFWRARHTSRPRPPLARAQGRRSGEARHRARGVGSVAESAVVAVNAPEVARPAADPARFRHAPSGRQTPAKRKYVEGRRVGEWRRGESNRPVGDEEGEEVAASVPWGCRGYRPLLWFPAVSSLRDARGTSPEGSARTRSRWRPVREGWTCPRPVDTSLYVGGPGGKAGLRARGRSRVRIT